MTPEQRKLARHALGLPNRYKRSYRNRYFVGKGAPAHDAWMGLVADGLANAEHAPDSPRKTSCFWLTRAGAEMALDPGESLDPEDFPGA